jgi:hypothetical protein
VNHDFSASDIGGDHRIEIAPDRLGIDSTDLLVAGTMTATWREPDALWQSAAGSPHRPRSPRRR